MATPSLSRHTLPGALGEIAIDVRAGGRNSPRPAVVVVHGFKGFKDWGMFPPFAERLARAGFSAVTFNMSGNGVDAAGGPTHPDRFARNTYSAELADLGMVLDALAQGRLGVAPPEGIGLVGHSRGGGVSVLQASRDDRIRSLVTWSAIATVVRWDETERRAWRARGHLDVMNARTRQIIPLTTELLDEIERADPALDIPRAARMLRVPWLLVHGTDDESVPITEAEQLLEESGSPDTRLLRIDGAGHTFGAAHPWTPAAAAGPIERVFDATLSWLAASVV